MSDNLRSEDEPSVSLPRPTKEPIEVRTRRHGLLQFRWITLNSWQFVKQLPADLPARDFTRQVLWFHLEAPKLEQVTVSSWSNSVLARVATIWSKDQRTLGTELPAGGAAFVAFRVAALGQLSRMEMRLQSVPSLFDSHRNLEELRRQVIGPAADIQRIISQATTLNAGFSSSIGAVRAILAPRDLISRSTFFPAPSYSVQNLGQTIAKSLRPLPMTLGISRELTQTLNQASRRISGAFAPSPLQQVLSGTYGKINLLAASGIAPATLNLRISGFSDEVRKQIEMITAIPRMSSTLKLDQSLSAAILAESALLGLSPAVLGRKLDLTPHEREHIQQRVEKTSESLLHLYDSVATGESTSIQHPRELLELPATEFFTETEAIRLGSDVGEIEDDLYEERARFTTEILIETSEELPLLLQELGPNFVRPLLGARQVIASGYADSVRQAIVSLRELFTHVLHMLSPDDQVKAWNQSSNLYHQGRPTRRARLLFICRGLSHPPFSDFVEKSVADGLMVVDLFQRGTHGLEVPYTSAQTKILLAKMEGLIRFMLLAARTAETYPMN